MECRAIWAVSDLEVRQLDKRPVISGRFPYNTWAVHSDRGTVRKEEIMKGAFDFTLSNPLAEINLLFGHSFDKPLASRQSGSLTLTDTESFLEFVATIPEGAERASHVVDALAMLGSGLVKGVSPGFRVPPKNVVPDAEKLVPEPNNPSVMIRQLDLTPNLSQMDLPPIANDLHQRILTACGIPPALLSDSGNAGAMREAYRLFALQTVDPLARQITPELSRKLGVTRLGLGDMMSSDVAGRARAVGTLTKAGVDLETAMGLVGWQGVKVPKPTPPKEEATK